MKLSIIGASGHGKVVADIAEKNGYDEIEFFDDNAKLKYCGKRPISGTVNQAFDRENDFIIAIGNEGIRKKFMEIFHGKHFPTLIHPDAVIADDVEIGEGSVIMAGVVINSGTRIGRGAIINTCASVDHDCIIGDYAHISVGSHIGGSAVIGNGTWIAIGASIINNVSVCPGCIIGAGGVVVRSIDVPGTYVGVPVRRIR